MKCPDVDPFLGTEVSQLRPPRGLAATWWLPKPQVGNTHPGACSPLGMVSACAYSGAYPTGYGLYDKSTEGLPAPLFDRYQSSGFTHFQQSGTGAIRKYYNYLRVTPMLGPLDELGTSWPLWDETAEPGYYAATLGGGRPTADQAVGDGEVGIRSEITVGPKSAVHRYRFPSIEDARVVVDLSCGGLVIEHGRTVPMKASIESLGGGAVCGQVVMEGVPVSIYAELDAPASWRSMLWFDRRLMEGGSRLEFDSLRETTLRAFGAMFRGPIEAGDVVELRIGFSLRGVEQARANLVADCGTTGPVFSRRRRLTTEAWAEVLDRIEVTGGSPDRRSVMATALYHSLIKPCLAADESPFWDNDGPFAFDIATMWDIYKTQIPLLTLIAPDKTVELLAALLRVAEQEGNFPIGYRMARGADRFSRQGSALAHTAFADLCRLGLGDFDWEWVLLHLHADLRRTYGEDYLENGLAHPITHTLDLATGYDCTAEIAERVGDLELADRFRLLAEGWAAAFDPATGLLVDSTFYEGGRWNYSFRLLHDMSTRIALAGGDEAFVRLLDAFFGFDAEPVEQLGRSPSEHEVAAGYLLDRFEGLNNEPDMEAPYAYHYAGRPDRTAEVVHAITQNMFGTGRGGLPGNDDSGGLSSWYVWASLGLFPVAGQGVVLISTPAFAQSRVRTARGEFSVMARGFVEPTPDSPAQFIQSASLDGVALDRSFLTLTELHAGGELLLELGATPSAWGTVARPPSNRGGRPSPSSELKKGIE